MDQDQKKRAAAARAVEYIDPYLRNDSIIGVGTGSTANYFIEALAAIKHKFYGAVASSIASEQYLRFHGIPVNDLNGVPEPIFYVDGADETDARLQLIKGGGGALTGEKIVASVATHFLCIVDESKLVEKLGGYPLPIEVIPMARSAVARALVGLGGKPVWRQGFTTDNGNMILDIHDMTIDDAPALETRINNIPGMVCNGLFAVRPADVLLIGTASGVEIRKR